MANEIAVLKMETNERSAARSEIALALGKPPEHKDVSRFIAGAIMEIEDKTTLKACSPQSIIKCLIQCANLGLAVDNRKLAYLVPFGGQCTLMPGYLGYISKIKEADPTAFVTVGIVHKGDKFECRKQSGHAEYIHIPANAFADGSMDIEGAYCHIRTVNGSSLELMSKKELDKVRSSSKMKSGAVWSTWELEMIKKSVVRRACKLQFTEAVSQLNAIDDRLYDMSNKPQIATLSPTAPMPEPIQAAIAHEVMPEEVESALEANMPEDTESAPINEPGAPSEALPNANTAEYSSFSGIVKAFSPMNGSKPAGIKLDDGNWYNSANQEIIAIIKGLKGEQVSGTYSMDGKYRKIETLGD